MSSHFSHQHHQQISQQQNGYTDNYRTVRHAPVIKYESSNESDNASFTGSEYSGFSDESEPLWLEEPMPAGEMFYVEDSPANGNANNGAYDSVHAQFEASVSHVPQNHDGNQAVTKSVYVTVRSSLDSRTPQSSLLANMLGIIALDSKFRRRQNCQPVNLERIVVDALVPGGACIRNGQVAIGDVLIAINDEAVVASNIEHFLKMFAHPCKLKLTFQSGKPQSSVVVPADNDVQQEISVQVLNPSRQSSYLCGLHEPHGVFYLTLSVHSDTAAENDDILYVFPTIETTGKIISKLILIRGLFVTLSDVMRDTFSDNILTSTIVVDDNILHCTYHFVNTEVFVMCLPAASYSLPQAQVTMANVVRLLIVMYGSVASAFQPENRQRLDHLFRFIILLNGSSDTTNAMFSNTINWKPIEASFLRLTPDLFAHANAGLAQLEACDFEDGSSGHNYIRRLYTVRGSCVFYDGHLIVSHVPVEDQRDISLFCYNHALLSLNQKERVSLLLIWREVFPWNELMHTDGTKDKFSAVKGRCFLMIVGLKHSLLCSLLQLNGNLFPSSHTPRPDPLYVNKARATILNLETAHFQDFIRKRLQTVSYPLLTDSSRLLTRMPNAFLKSFRPPSGRRQRSSKFVFGSPLKPKRTDPDSVNALSGNTPQKPSKQSRETSSAPESSSPSLVRGLFREKSFSSQGSAESTNSGKQVNHDDLAYSLDGIRDAANVAVYDKTRLYQNVTVGVENALFCYLSFEKLRGILIVPTMHDLRVVGSSVHNEVVSNFRKQVLCLHQRLSCRSVLDDDCIEEGILFQCCKPTHPTDSKAKQPFLQYWIIGRVVQKPVKKEIYVCFHNSATQNMVELAFRML